MWRGFFLGLVGYMEFVVGLRDKMEIFHVTQPYLACGEQSSLFEYLNNYVERLPVIELVLVGFYQTRVFNLVYFYC